MSQNSETEELEFGFERDSPYHPPEVFGVLRERGPVCRVTLPSGERVWAITRYDEVRACFADARFSSDRTDPAFPGFQGGGPPTTPYLVGMDPPDHTVARKALIGEFTLRRTDALLPRVRQIVDDHIDAMLAGPRPVDLVHALALPVPSLVICELLGVPYDDHDFFQTRSAELMKHEADGRRAAGELREYLFGLLRTKEKLPSDDLLSRQLERQREAGEPNYALLIELAFILLIAGHETTANMISLGSFALLEHPDQLAAIRADPSKTPGAVEELLRTFTIADAVTGRVTTEEVEVGGTRIPAGEGVLLLGNSANHDPSTFDAPDEFDVERSARSHVAFGYGIHQCLGQNLARLELRVVFDQLFARIPGLRLAVPVSDLPFKDDGVVYGLYELPVTW